MRREHAQGGHVVTPFASIQRVHSITTSGFGTAPNGRIPSRAARPAARLRPNPMCFRGLTSRQGTAGAIPTIPAEISRTTVHATMGAAQRTTASGSGASVRDAGSEIVLQVFLLMMSDGPNPVYFRVSVCIPTIPRALSRRSVQPPQNPTRNPRRPPRRIKSLLRARSALLTSRESATARGARSCIITAGSLISLATGFSIMPVPTCSFPRLGARILFVKRIMTAECGMKAVATGESRSLSRRKS